MEFRRRFLADPFQVSVYSLLFSSNHFWKLVWDASMLFVFLYCVSLKSACVLVSSSVLSRFRRSSSFVCCVCEIKRLSFQKGEERFGIGFREKKSKKRRSDVVVWMIMSVFFLVWRRRRRKCLRKEGSCCGSVVNLGFENVVSGCSKPFLLLIVSLCARLCSSLTPLLRAVGSVIQRPVLG